MQRLQLEDIHKSYAGVNGNLCVLQGVSLALQAGDTAAIVGPSGSGKSTLLHIIGTLDQPSSGKVILESQDVFALPASQQAQLRAKKIGFVFQDHQLLPQLTALENVCLPTLGHPLKNYLTRANELLELVGMTARRDAFSWQLSGGERQRIAIARALLQSPSLLLCDEPTGNLDHKNAENVMDLLLQLANRQQVSIIMVTHNLELAKRCSKCWQMKDGKLLSF